MYNNELYHYGRKGMKWGQHIFGKGRNNAVSSSVKKRNIARGIDKNASLTKKYVKTIEVHGKNSPQYASVHKQIQKHNQHLRDQVVDYLDSISAKKVKELVKFDSEHGKHYVELRAFDKKWNKLDDGIYIDNKRNAKINPPKHITNYVYLNSVPKKGFKTGQEVADWSEKVDKDIRDALEYKKINKKEADECWDTLISLTDYYLKKTSGEKPKTIKVGKPNVIY
jgi:hypothetical protein